MSQFLNDLCMCLGEIRRNERKVRWSRRWQTGSSFGEWYVQILVSKCIWVYKKYICVKYGEIKKKLRATNHHGICVLKPRSSLAGHCRILRRNGWNVNAGRVVVEYGTVYFSPTVDEYEPQREYGVKNNKKSKK